MGALFSKLNLGDWANPLDEGRVTKSRKTLMRPWFGWVWGTSAVGMYEGMAIVSEKPDYSYGWIPFWIFLVIYVFVAAKKHDLLF